ncbi:hypothetical protein, partial [Escherichia coli]|uniref:hypothetical protein n=1 Tax=Escherichia coli TaxID=562 RepID=UPI001BDBFE68
VTPAMVQDVWDTFVKPGQSDDAPPQSAEMRALMGILRAVHAALEDGPIPAEIIPGSRTVPPLPPESDGAVIVHLEREAIRAKDNTGHHNDFHRLTYDTDTRTWYGMDLAGNLRWTTTRDITPGTWKVADQ